MADLLAPPQRSHSLGATRITIPPLGIGTWAWGGRVTWGFGGYSREDLRAAFKAALEAGVNFFDTAEVYGLGRSEMLLGRFIREEAGEHEVVVATKFAPFPWRPGKLAVRLALRLSLKRLGLPRVDLYQIHWPYVNLLPFKVWLEAMAEAVAEGLVGAVGVSNYSRDQMLRAHDVLSAHGIPLASNQVHYSLLHRQPETDGVLDACRERNITLIAYSPLEMGILTGKYTPESPLPGIRGVRYGRACLECVQPLLDEMREIGVAHGDKSPAQVALNWLLCKDVVPIPGVKNVRHTQSNAGALGWRMSEAEVAALDEASERALQALAR